MTNLNIFTIMGNITGNAEEHQSGNNVLLSFSVACNRSKDSTDFIPVRVNKSFVPEKTRQKLVKGAPIRVTGRFECGSYDKDGQKKYYSYLSPEMLEMNTRGNLNNGMLMGRLTADPIMRNTQAGKSVASFTVACNRQYKDKQSGEWKDAPTSFVSVTAWEKTADFVCQYFKKGDMIALAGELRSRGYQDKNGNNRTAYEVLATKVSFANPVQAAPAQTAPAQAAAAAPAQNNAGGYGSYGTYPQEDFEAISDDEDLPF